MIKQLLKHNERNMDHLNHSWLKPGFSKSCFKRNLCLFLQWKNVFLLSPTLKNISTTLVLMSRMEYFCLAFGNFITVLYMSYVFTSFPQTYHFQSDKILQLICMLESITYFSNIPARAYFIYLTDRTFPYHIIISKTNSHT